MDYNDYEDLFSAAVVKWGENEQLWMVVEELGETLAAINKFRRSRKNVEDLAEEVADAMMMLGQLRYMIGYSVVDEKIRYKVNRLWNRLVKK